jgi:arabinogalactan oligomer/maltooligosaccharide transport system permease protein
MTMAATINKVSLPRLLTVHLLLSVACIVATFPIFRIVAISFRNTDTVSAAAKSSFPPPGEATADDYVKFFADSVVLYEIIDAILGKEKAAPAVVESVKEEATAIDPNDPFASLDQASASKVTERRWYSNYTDLFSRYLFLQWIYNSIMISLSASLIGIFLSATAAYAFSRFEFPGKRFALGFLFMTQMIPGPLMIIPVYLVIKSLNLGNSYAGLVIAMSVTILPFSIMVLRGYFETVPKSLEEAARVDGCTAVSAFFRILLPLSTPALAIAFLFAFTSAWSEFLLASTLIDDASLRPWTLGLMEFSGNYDARWGLFAAGSVVIALPSMILFLYSSKYVISGLTVGSVKG